MSTPQAVFGPGILIATRTDLGTNAGVAINVGYSQELQIDFAATVKQLYGQYQFPLVSARGTIKATGKFKAATVSGLAMNALYWGGSFSTSTSVGISWNVGSTVTTSTVSTSAIQVGSSLTFDADLGITYAASGLPLRRVSTGSEVTGSYSLTTGSPGLYNFAAGDTTGGAAGGTNLKITYTQTGATGQQLLMPNQLIGTTPTFQLDYYTTLTQGTAAKTLIIRLYEAVAEKQTFAFKLEDFMIPEYDFGLYANAAGNLFLMQWPEVS